MADAPQRRGKRRAAARAQQEEDGRRARQRLDDVETRLDTMDSRIAQHEMRLSFLESNIKVVLRGSMPFLSFLEPKTMTIGLPRLLSSLHLLQR